MRLKRVISATALLIIVLVSASSWAGTIMNLPIKGGGIFAYGAGERIPRFYAHGIRVGDLSYGSNTLPILGGRLGFSGGTFLGSSGNDFFWGAGGSISVKGCADLNHDGKCGSGDFKGTLITGKFLSAELIMKNGKEFLEAQISDQLNPQLAALLNLPDTTYHGKIELLLTRLGNGKWWVHDRVQGGFLNNYGTIPEAPSLWMLGASLVVLGVGRFSWRVIASPAD
jgi:hypothetical protein